MAISPEEREQLRKETMTAAQEQAGMARRQASISMQHQDDMMRMQKQQIELQNQQLVKQNCLIDIQIREAEARAISAEKDAGTYCKTPSTSNP